MWQKISKRILVYTPLFFVASLASLGGYFIWSPLNAQLPDTLKFGEFESGVVLVDSEGQPIYSTLGINTSWLSLVDISPYLIDAVQAVEDCGFYRHNGFSPSSMIRAMWANIKQQRLVQGGSTITQQLARMLFLSREKTYVRKIAELRLAFKLEEKFTKEEILAGYLNRAYFGNRSIGIGAASWNYFRKPAKDLTLEEAAALAATLKAPSLYSPASNPARNQARRAVVIKRMVKCKQLDAQIGRMAARAPVKAFMASGRSSRHRYVYQEASQILNARIGVTRKRGLITIGTELDQKLSDRLDARIDSFIESLTGGSDLAKSDIGSAYIFIDPRTNYIKAWRGGSDFGSSQFDLVKGKKIYDQFLYEPLVYQSRFRQRGYLKFQEGSLGGITDSEIRYAMQRFNLGEQGGVLAKAGRASLRDFAGAYSRLVGGYAACEPRLVKFIKKEIDLIYESSPCIGERLQKAETFASLIKLNSLVDPAAVANFARAAYARYGWVGYSSNEIFFVNLQSNLVGLVWLGPASGALPKWRKIPSGQLTALWVKEMESIEKQLQELGYGASQGYLTPPPNIGVRSHKSLVGRSIVIFDTTRLGRHRL